MTNKKTISVNLEMDSHTNEIVTLSAITNKRSKRQEAAARLKDHAARFDVKNTNYVIKNK